VPLTERPTADVVLLILVTLLALVVAVTTIGVMTLTITRPDLDLTVAVNNLGNTTSALTGAVLGFLAGRRSATGG
jgi:hypothetical protein